MNTANNNWTARWPVYLMEAALLGGFMISACAMDALLEHPNSMLHHIIPSADARRGLMGLVMGLTAVFLIHSRWGRRSGAHMNPAVTLSFLWLGHIDPLDAACYIVAQFLGAAAGVGVVFLIAGAWLSDPSVNFAVTTPGPAGALWAWLAEFIISYILMAAILAANRRPAIAPFTPWIAGTLVGVYIFLEAPLSGMSMNPARTFGSAIWATTWTAWWIYFTAPIFGMLLAVEMQRLMVAAPQHLCIKFIHCHKISCLCSCHCGHQKILHPVQDRITSKCLTITTCHHHRQRRGQGNVAASPGAFRQTHSNVGALGDYVPREKR